MKCAVCCVTDSPESGTEYLSLKYRFPGAGYVKVEQQFRGDCNPYGTRCVPSVAHSALSNTWTGSCRNEVCRRNGLLAAAPEISKTREKNRAPARQPHATCDRPRGVDRGLAFLLVPGTATHRCVATVCSGQRNDNEKE